MPYSSRISCGSWARIAASAMRPNSSTSRIRIRVSRSSFSIVFWSAILFSRRCCRALSGPHPRFSGLAGGLASAASPGRRVEFPAMSKAFVRESEQDEASRAEPGPPPAKNYISPAGYARLKAELKQLVETERPEVVHTVSWAAKNGDRSENGDYLYGKKRLREIDRRVRFLIKRLESAEVVDPAGRDSDQIFFGSTGRLRSGAGGAERTAPP